MKLRIICFNKISILILSLPLSLILILTLIPCPALQSQNAPVTAAGRVIDAVPGDTAVQVPVDVYDFTDIGQFTLTMKFDTNRVKYISSVTNPSLQGMTVSYTPPSGNSLGKLVLAWTGTENLDLPDGSSLADIRFHYVSGTGLLSWSYTFGSICRYKRYSEGSLITLADSPKYTYYENGGISNRTSPVMEAPVIASPQPGPVPIALATMDFIDIKSFTLYLEYDPAIIVYQNSFTKNPAFDSNFIVGDNPGTGNTRFIVMQWFGSNPVTLTNGSHICTLDFNYPAAGCDPCPLTWYDTGPTCEFADGAGDVLIDIPAEDYYQEGIVAPGLPVTWTGNAGNDWFNELNWDACGLPGKLRSVIIPDVSPNEFPVINLPAECYTITIGNNAVISISPSGSLHVGEQQ